MPNLGKVTEEPGSGVSKINNISGAVNITAGQNVTVTPSGQNIAIASTDFAYYDYLVYYDGTYYNAVDWKGNLAYGGAGGAGGVSGSSFSGIMNQLVKNSGVICFKINHNYAMDADIQFVAGTELFFIGGGSGLYSSQLSEISTNSFHMLYDPAGYFTLHFERLLIAVTGNYTTSTSPLNFVETLVYIDGDVNLLFNARIAEVGMPSYMTCGPLSGGPPGQPVIWRQFSINDSRQNNPYTTMLITLWYEGIEWDNWSLTFVMSASSGQPPQNLFNIKGNTVFKSRHCDVFHNTTYGFQLINPFCFGNSVKVSFDGQEFPVPGAPFVQGPIKTTASIASGAITCTSLTSTPKSGDTLFLTYMGYGATVRPNISSITQTGVTWTKGRANNTNSNLNVEVWAGSVGAGASKTITVNISGGSGGSYVEIINVCEFKEVYSTTANKNAINNGSGTTLDSGTTLATSQDCEITIAALAGYGNYSQSTPTNGYTLLDGAATSGCSLGFLYNTLTKVQTTEVSDTVSNSITWAGAICTYYLTSNVVPPMITCSNPGLVVQVNDCQSNEVGPIYIPTVDANTTLLVSNSMQIKLGIGPAVNITPGVSPYVYQNLDTYAENISVTGGTVSLIEFSRDGVNYYPVTNTLVTLMPNDYLRVTYSVTPTMVKFPMVNAGL
jgi:hypothetical protein